MEIQYIYMKKRTEFGRQCLFHDKGPELIDNYLPHKELLDEYILKDPVSQGTQYGPQQGEHSVNTVRAKFSNVGINHTEGGWPKDVNIHDEEQTKRYKRKVEKDDAYNPSLMALCKNMECYILQNNAINIYQQYFADCEPAPYIEKSSSRTVNVYQDPCTISRPINTISWSPDNQTKIAVSYCNLKFQYVAPEETLSSFIWEVENPNRPLLIFKPSTPTVCIEYNQKDPNSLVSGQANGLVAVWDTRRGPGPVELSIMEESHRDPVCSVLWINSKTGTEFFSASSDGQVKWWDTRKMAVPLENLILSSPGQIIEKALGASCLEYDSGAPQRFSVGTEQGVAIGCNRKGKSPSEKMSLKFAAHLGPVLRIQRNAAFVKNFLTIGDWSAKIFSEECRESPIMWTNYHKPMLTDGAWSPTRYSVYFTTRSDGILDVWDVIEQQKHPCLAVKLCDDPLTTIRTHDEGRLLAIGNEKGTVNLVQLSENLQTCNKNDKMLLTAMFERESKREKILEARNREIRLKLRAKSAQALVTESGTAVGEEKPPSVASFADPFVVQAEEEFFKTIHIELYGPEIEAEEEEEPQVIEEPEPPPVEVPAADKKEKKKKK